MGRMACENENLLPFSILSQHLCRISLTFRIKVYKGIVHGYEAIGVLEEVISHGKPQGKREDILCACRKEVMA